MAPPEKVDKIVEHQAEECPHCPMLFSLPRPGQFLPWHGTMSGNYLKSPGHYGAPAAGRLVSPLSGLGESGFAG